jgi:hypothetical protein
MKAELKSMLDKLVFLHVTLKNEVNSEKPDKDKIEATFDIQALTLLELKDELNGSYYMTDDEKQSYYHEEEKRKQIILNHLK